MQKHPDIAWQGEPIDVPDGRSATFTDTAGNTLHVFDQSKADISAD